MTIPPIKLNVEEYRLLLNQVARSWALAAVRSHKPAATQQEQRRYAKLADSWADILRRMDILPPAVHLSAFIKRGPLGGVVWDWKGADVERGRLVNEICRPKKAAAKRALKLAAGP